MQLRCGSTVILVKLRFALYPVLNSSIDFLQMNFFIVHVKREFLQLQNHQTLVGNIVYAYEPKTVFIVGLS